MKMRFYIVAFLFGLVATGVCQTQSAAAPKGIPVRVTIVDGDTIPTVWLNTVTVIGPLKFKNKRLEEKYNRLKRDVKKTYPYAIVAGARLKQYNTELAKIKTEAARDKYIKKAEKELFAQFEKDMRNLTVNQGKILIKLIERETDQTSYQIVKEMRGSFSAFMWQSVAVLFGSSLKYQYDANGDDVMIERIICMIESGEI